MCVNHRIKCGDEPPRLHGSLGKMAAGNKVQGRWGVQMRREGRGWSKVRIKACLRNVCVCVCKRARETGRWVVLVLVLGVIIS